MKILNIITIATLFICFSAEAYSGNLQIVIQNNKGIPLQDSCYASNAKIPLVLSADLSNICESLNRFSSKANKITIQGISILDESASKILVVANLPQKDTKKDYGPRFAILKKDVPNTYKVIYISNGSFDTWGIDNAIYKLENHIFVLANYFDESNSEIALFELRNDTLTKIGKSLMGEHLDFKILSLNPESGNFILGIEKEDFDVKSNLPISRKESYELINQNWIAIGKTTATTLDHPGT